MPRPDISSNRRGQRRTNTPFSHVRRTAPYHVHWRTIQTHEATYKAGKRGKGKQTIHVKTIGKILPPEFRDFQLSGNTLKTFKRVSLKTTTRKAIVIMATKTKDKKTEKAAKKSRKKGPAESEEEVDEELEGLEELSEDEEPDESTDDDESTDEDSDDDESDDDDSDDDDDDEDVEKPKSSKKKGKKGKKTTRAKANGKVGTQEIAAEAGCDARTLRMVLRKHEVEKDEESNRYEWDSMENSTVKKILKWIKEGEAKAVKKEGLDKLKEKKEKEKAAEGKKGKGKKKSKKKKEEDDDEN